MFGPTPSTPLFSNESTRFSECIYSLLKRESPEDPHKKWRIFGKGLGAIAALISQGPFIEISLKIPGIEGKLGATCNALGFSIMQYCTTAALIDLVLSPMTSTERALVEKTKLNCKKISIITLNLGLALSSQYPNAVPAYVYNPEPYKKTAFLVVLVFGSLPALYSGHLSIDWFRQYWGNTFEREMSKIKHKISGLLLENRDVFLSKKQTEKEMLIGEVSRLRTSGYNVVNQYMEKMLFLRTQPLSRCKTVTKKLFDVAGTVSGLYFLIVFEAVTGMYTYGSLSDHPPTAAVFSALTVGSTLFLYGKSIVDTTRRAFNFVGNCLTCSEPRNLGFQYRAKISFTLTLLAILVDYFACLPTWIIYDDFFGKKTEAERNFYVYTSCVSFFLLIFTFALDLVDEMISLSMEQSPDNQREIFLLAQEFQKLASIIQASRSQAFFEFLVVLRPDARAQILERIGVTQKKFTEIRELRNNHQKSKISELINPV